MDGIETEWVFHEDCGLPVLDRGDYLEEVHLDGVYGSIQIPLGVEHECPHEGRRG